MATIKEIENSLKQREVAIIALIKIKRLLKGVTHTSAIFALQLAEEALKDIGD